MQTKLTDKFEKIEQQLEEHLSTINENTFEVQSLFDYLQQIESKVDKLSERLDQLQLFKEQQSQKNLTLNQVESQVFFALYTEETPLSFTEIAVKANLPVSLIPECLSALAEKGVPFSRSFYGDKLFLKLDAKFKEQQARENMINLSLETFMR